MFDSANSFWDNPRLVGEAAAAVSIGDGLLFKGSEGAAESWLVGVLQSLSLLSCST